MEAKTNITTDCTTMGIMILRLALTPQLDLNEQLTIEANELRIW